MSSFFQVLSLQLCFFIWTKLPPPITASESRFSSSAPRLPRGRCAPEIDSPAYSKSTESFLCQVPVDRPFFPFFRGGVHSHGFCLRVNPPLLPFRERELVSFLRTKGENSAPQAFLVLPSFPRRTSFSPATPEPHRFEIKEVVRA